MARIVRRGPVAAFPAGAAARPQQPRGQPARRAAAPPPMPRGALARWGLFVYHHRGLALGLSGLVLLASIAAMATGGQLVAFQPPQGTESDRALELMSEELPATGNGAFLLVLHSPSMQAQDPAFRAAVDEALAGLRADPRVERVTSPYDAPPERAPTLLGRDGHTIAVQVQLRASQDDARPHYGELRQKVRSSQLEVTAAQSLAIAHDFDTILAHDLEQAETVSLPLVLLLLLVVFGAVVAALLPLAVGVLAIVGGIGGVLLLANFTDVTLYATNVVTLIGLGVAIDYSLFIVARFREEMARKVPRDVALARTMATAGRAVLFSGLTVAVGLSGLLFYQGLFLAMMGLAGALVVLLAVFYALVFLPALLATLGPRVDKGRIRRRSGGSLGEVGEGWRKLAHGVMRRPVAVLVPVVLLLVVVGSPFLQLDLAAGNVEQLPESAESRRGEALLQAHFPDLAAEQLAVLVAFPGGDPLSPERVGALYDFSRSLAALPRVAGVQSIVDLDPAMTKEDYQRLYSQPRDQLPPPVRRLVEETVGPRSVLLSALNAAPLRTQAARDAVADVRAAPGVPGSEVLVTGTSAIDLDTLEAVYADTPLAVGYIVAVTFLLILAQTGSVVLPVKAVLMNILSIAASFGALVWVFQQGNLSGVLDFTPGPLDPSVPVLLFATVFGLSMDYEVLMLSRIHEEYLRTGDNTHAVAEGLQRSGGLITGAAAIMTVVFAAFALTSVVVVKAFGLGLALAVLVDATLVRALVVPAAMRLMGKANWWGPKWLQRWAEHGQPAPSRPSRALRRA